MKDEVPELGERTKAFALRVIDKLTARPKTEEARVLGRQVLLSGTSVGANYREARRGHSKAEFIAKIGDSLKELDEPSGERQTGRKAGPKGPRGSADQTAYWLELLVDSGIVPSDRLAPLRDECEQLLAIFTTISKKSKSSPS